MLSQRLMPKGENDGRTFVGFVHKFKELVHNGLEEFPMRLEKARVLTNNIHDIGRDDGLVILASLHLHQAEELLDDRHQESLLRLFI
jgi:hypothetical protein